MTTRIIEIEGLTHSYPDGTEALHGIDLTIDRGEMVALIGENGAGKTTLAKHLNGLLKAGAGRVRVAGMDAALTPVARLGKTVGYVFQNPDHQIFNETVAGEVAFGLRNLGLGSSAVRERVARALTAVGLSEYSQACPFHLSRGQRQRVALASVLAMQTDVIVLDEPTTGQDHRESLEIMALVQRLHQKGHTIIFITHDMSLVARFARRVVVLGNGRVLADGAVRDILSRAELLARTCLEPPAITRLAGRCAELGIPGNLLTVEEMYRCLSRQMERGVRVEHCG